MNKFFTFLVLLTTLLTKVTLAQTNISFKTYGHDDEVVYGMSGVSSFYFRMDPQVDMNRSKLVLFYEPSQALIKNMSFVNILIADKPVYSGRMTQDSIQRLVIPLDRSYLTDNNQFLKVQVKTLLTITDNKCKDLDNPAMWIKVKGYSFLSLVKNAKDLNNHVNISNAFESKTAIVYPSVPSLNDLKAVAWAYNKIKRSLAVSDLRVYAADRVPDSIRNYVMVGTLDALPADKRSLIKVTPGGGQGLIYIHKGGVDSAAFRPHFVSSISGARQAFSNNEIMFVTGADDSGYEKAITALGNYSVLNSSFGNYLVINTADNDKLMTLNRQRTKLTFRDVGGVSNFMSGIGSLRSVYNFKNSDFTFTPKEIEMHFVANYSGMSANDRGFFNIYLNGMLISSEKLNESGKLNATVVVNRYQHRKYNSLTAEFRFYPSNGNCQNSFLNFFGEIDVDKSYLESRNPFVNNTLSFYQYPEAFNEGDTRIVVSKNAAKYAAGAIGEVVYELNNNLNSNNFPTFAYSDEVTDADLKKYNVIALLSKDDQLMEKFPDAPIKFNHAFRLYRNEDNKDVYSLSDSVSNGLSQIFYGRGSNNASLVLTATGSDLSGAFLSAAKAITEQLSTLNSNVCVSDVMGNKYLFNIDKASDNIEYTDAKSGLARFWENYNLYILLGVLVLILLAFLYVRSRVQRSQDFLGE
ncbi:cellulose biosynthesis cyclic di-GMP-binding regulatory protein BcsB [Mucilaginibacter daejeonensis]|uniref:cellulose biosynthesis cyclic di-GMP-binding regulatory protein BcsB n=1 Tax=Mucilaginibacter daejeonensis TaxID=398049 RepID=UPI001D17A368|nr:cellulose biosynthesis cyclic di-GMP-binding regulatory protein BcsB [Mucilaginibacter daejeonensis]UEG53127.1 cellulose biosynthesis cyclic di-GMP-binding regulatory protein BcsB [Mucilaginibacter daejeonensis]